MKKVAFFFICFLTLFISSNAQLRITPEEAKNHIGELVTVCGKIFEGKFLESTKTQPTLFNMGDAYPNQPLTILVAFEDRSSFPAKPEVYYAASDVCVTGNVILYKDKPEIKIKNSQQIEITKVKETVKKETVVSRKPATVPKKEVVTPQKEVDRILNEGQVKLASEVNLRSGPGINYPINTVLKAGTIVSIVLSAGEWSQISAIIDANGRTIKADISGYIKSSLLK